MADENTDTPQPAKKTRRELALLFSDAKTSEDRKALAVQYPELREMYSEGSF